MDNLTSMGVYIGPRDEHDDIQEDSKIDDEVGIEDGESEKE